METCIMELNRKPRNKVAKATLNERMRAFPINVVRKTGEP
jgi:hypothetical protein